MSKHGDAQTGDVLVDTQGNGQQGHQQAAQDAGQDGGKETNPQGAGGIGGIEADECAEEHDAFNTQIQHMPARSE